MIYLASPYSHPNPLIRQKRYLAARTYAHDQMANGVVIFSPIVYGHQFSVSYGYEPAHEAWIHFNTKMMYAAERMEILCLDGWEESRGIAHEIDFAYQIGLPYNTVYL